jgi:hypothetical protein
MELELHPATLVAGMYRAELLSESFSNEGARGFEVSGPGTSAGALFLLGHSFPT